MSTNFAVPINNASTSIAVAATTGSGLPATPYVINVASGAVFPALTGSQYYRVTICQVAFAYSPTATTSNYTIYKADTISANTIRLVSVLEGTTDRVYNIGDIVEIRVTAGTLSDIHTAVNALEYWKTETSVTGTTALSSTAYGTTQLCSGTSSNYTVTLPAPVAGGIIAFRMASGLTKLVTIAQHASETIDGAASRVMWANETATLVSDGTNWFKLAGKSLPMASYIYAGVDTSLTENQWNFVPLKSVFSDNTGGLMTAGVSTNGYINILRSSVYGLYAQITGASGTTTSGYISTGISTATSFSPGPTVGQSAFYYQVTPQAFAPSIPFLASSPLTAGSFVCAGVYPYQMSITSTAGIFSGNNFLSVVEQISW